MEKQNVNSINDGEEEQQSLSQMEEHRTKSYDSYPLVKSLLEGKERR
jgi:hypothetical protein